jgi:hypothetical protein
MSPYSSVDIIFGALFLIWSVTVFIKGNFTFGYPGGRIFASKEKKSFVYWSFLLLAFTIATVQLYLGLKKALDAV